MPELPDVEIYRRYLGAVALQKKIKKAEVTSKKILENISSRTLTEELVSCWSPDLEMKTKSHNFSSLGFAVS